MTQVGFFFLTVIGIMSVFSHLRELSLRLITMGIESLFVAAAGDESFD